MLRVVLSQPLTLVGSQVHLQPASMKIRICGVNRKRGSHVDLLSFDVKSYVAVVEQAMHVTPQQKTTMLMVLTHIRVAVEVACLQHGRSGRTWNAQTDP